MVITSAHEAPELRGICSTAGGQVEEVVEQTRNLHPQNMTSPAAGIRLWQAVPGLFLVFFEKAVFFPDKGGEAGCYIVEHHLSRFIEGQAHADSLRICLETPLCARTREMLSSCGTRCSVLR